MKGAVQCTSLMGLIKNTWETEVEVQWQPCMELLGGALGARSPHYHCYRKACHLSNVNRIFLMIAIHKGCNFRVLLKTQLDLEYINHVNFTGISSDI